MRSQRPECVILIGPSGSGKSELAGRLARALDYAQVDIDAAIVERIGMPIATFFARFGEAAFRAVETETLVAARARRGVVIATGGGAVLRADNWRAMRPESVIIGLIATPETLAQRVAAQIEQAGVAAARPLLAGDAVEQMRAMLAERGPFYARADAVIDTENLSVEQVAERALAAIEKLSGSGRIPALSLATSGERSDIYVRRDISSAVAELIRGRWPDARRVWIVSDEHVAAHWVTEVERQFSAAGYDVRELVVAPGEGSKSFAAVERLCNELTTTGASRRDIVVALGGGVVGDLAGFVAAIALRGLRLAQLPTSLLAMVDSSVGGKTGVNTPGGKNLVGAFYQPGIIAIDPRFLRTLPRAEYRSGMAEVIKHALIQPSTPLGGTSLLSLLDESPSIDPLPDEMIEAALALNVAIKASVVQADEREAGLRMLLNFGHTAGHAIEADGYRYRHGEAVGLGMIVAMRLAVEIGRIDVSAMQRASALLERANLPRAIDGRADSLLERMSRDKKQVEGALRWVLPNREGIVEIVSGVPVEAVRAALIASGAS